jgi:hypothetical protein
MRLIFPRSAVQYRMDAFRAKLQPEKNFSGSLGDAQTSRLKMKTRKAKAAEPSLRDLLSQNFLKAFERDLAEKDKGLLPPKHYTKRARRNMPRCCSTDAATEPKPKASSPLAAWRKSL